MTATLQQIFAQWDNKKLSNFLFCCFWYFLKLIEQEINSSANCSAYRLALSTENQRDFPENKKGFSKVITFSTHEWENESRLTPDIRYVNTFLWLLRTEVSFWQSSKRCSLGTIRVPLFLLGVGWTNRLSKLNNATTKSVAANIEFPFNLFIGFDWLCPFAKAVITKSDRLLFMIFWWTAFGNTTNKKYVYSTRNSTPTPERQLTEKIWLIIELGEYGN